jgi:hypothetical protein
VERRYGRQHQLTGGLVRKCHLIVAAHHENAIRHGGQNRRQALSLGLDAGQELAQLAGHEDEVLR